MITLASNALILVARNNEGEREDENWRKGLGGGGGEIRGREWISLCMKHARGSDQRFLPSFLLSSEHPNRAVSRGFFSFSFSSTSGTSLTHPPAAPRARLDFFICETPCSVASCCRHNYGLLRIARKGRCPLRGRPLATQRYFLFPPDPSVFPRAELLCSHPVNFLKILVLGIVLILREQPSAFFFVRFSRVLSPSTLLIWSNCELIFRKRLACFYAVHLVLLVWLRSKNGMSGGEK